MFKKVAVIVATLVLAFSILSISVLKAASIRYDFSGDAKKDNNQIPVIDYQLPYPGRILPDHPLWPLKALRDKVWLLVTLNRSRQAELMLLFADKRLVSSRILFEKGKPELAFSTFTKAEKYLEKASGIVDSCWRSGVDTKNLSTRIATAALKHREVAEELLNIAPEDAKPGIAAGIGYSKKAYNLCKESLISRGMLAPENPFNGD
jgi:hypothetical protein